jgi:hypothetical protein
MGRCTYCGKSAGLFRSEHSECRAQHDQGYKQITQIFDGLLNNAATVEQLRDRAADAARTRAAPTFV